MNYSAHYDRLIERARHRVFEGYRERHHVLPRCMGGGNERENLVNLTAEEHYVAHQLLVKTHPGNGGLALAAMRMAKQCTGNKAYGWLRKLAGLAASKQHAGKPKSPEHVAKVAAALRGKKQPPHTMEERAKQSAAQRGKKRAPRSPEWSKKLGVANLGNRYSVGRVVSLESRAKMRAAKLGKPQSAELIAKRAESLRGHIVSLETREKLSATHKARSLTLKIAAQLAAVSGGFSRSALCQV